MKSDVNEILSLPAGKSHSYIEATLIHSCPTSYSYKSAQYITFRKQGGEMEALYKVEAVLVLKPHGKEAIQRLNPQYRDRVQDYINYRMREWPFPDREDRRFYVLSETDQIDLPHKPQLMRNIQGHCYFTLDELLSGSKIVQVASNRFLKNIFKEKITMKSVSAQTESYDDQEQLDIKPDGRKKRITYQPSNPTIQSLYENYKDGDLILAPDFQRNFVWNKQKASNLIESIILNIPLPLIFTAKLGDKEEVVDGQQRLTSIFSFMDGVLPEEKTPFKLSKKLKVLSKEIGGKSYTELDEEYKKEIKKRALPFISIDEDCQEDIKFEMFERLNTNITPLNAQELRNCLYRGPYNNFLKKMAKYDDFNYIINKPKAEERMADIELVLMFCTFYHLTPDRYNKGLKQTLNIDMRKHQYASDEDLNELEKQFKKSVKLIKTIFGQNAFNVYTAESNNSGGFQSQFNQGLYQILMYWFIPYEERQVIPYIDLIKEELLNLEIHNSEFLKTLTGTGTSNTKKLKKKFEIWGNTIRGILNYPHNEPRSFSFKLKKELWENNQICQICSQKIISIDDAEVDHIICYWKGGKTIPENARLTHRICNRMRGYS